MGDVHARWEWKAMHVTPLHDRVLVRRLEEGEQKVGGIIIPDSATEKPQHGQAIAVGKGRVNDEGQRIPVAVGGDGTTRITRTAKQNNRTRPEAKKTTRTNKGKKKTRTV